MKSNPFFSSFLYVIEESLLYYWIKNFQNVIRKFFSLKITAEMAKNGNITFLVMNDLECKAKKPHPSRSFDFCETFF